MRAAPADLIIDRVPASGADRVLSASALFDRPLDRDAVTSLLGRDDHHLLLARLGSEAVGFALAHELPRLDGASPKLLLYEIGVDPGFRRRGVGRSLVEAVKEVGRRCGARSLFVITEGENEAAVALYRSAGGVRGTENERVFEFTL